MFKTLVSTRFIAPLFILLEILELLLIYRDYDKRISNIKRSGYNFFRISITLPSIPIAYLPIQSLMKLSTDRSAFSRQESVRRQERSNEAIVRGQLFAKLNDTYQRLARQRILWQFIFIFLTGRVFLDFIFLPNSGIIFLKSPINKISEYC